MKEFEIRQKIVNACRTKLPNLKTEDFIFVKREKKFVHLLLATTLTLTLHKSKKLDGNGKIYIRLKQDAAIVDEFSGNSSDDDELPIPSFMQSDAHIDSNGNGPNGVNTSCSSHYNTNTNSAGSSSSKI